MSLVRPAVNTPGTSQPSCACLSASGVLNAEHYAAAFLQDGEVCGRCRVADGEDAPVGFVQIAGQADDSNRELAAGFKLRHQLRRRPFGDQPSMPLKGQALRVVLARLKAGRHANAGRNFIESSTGEPADKSSFDRSPLARSYEATGAAIEIGYSGIRFCSGTQSARGRVGNGAVP